MLLTRRKQERAEKEAFWQPHLSAWRSSGLSAKGYCKANGLKQHQLMYWHYQLASKTPPENASQSPTTPEFIELQPIAGSTSTLHSSFDITTKQGLSITLSGAINSEIVKTILIEIRGLS